MKNGQPKAIITSDLASYSTSVRPTVFARTISYGPSFAFVPAGHV